MKEAGPLFDFHVRGPALVQSLSAPERNILNTTTWLTSREAAEYMSMNPETVRVLMRSKELRSVKTGRTYRTKTDWCDAYLMGENQWVL